MAVPLAAFAAGAAVARPGRRLRPRPRPDARRHHHPRLPHGDPDEGRGLDASSPCWWCCQVLGALVLYGKLAITAPSWLGKAHRVSGVVALVLADLRRLPLPVGARARVAATSTTARRSATRTVVHGVLGCAVFGAVVVKVAAVRAKRAPGWFLPVAGGLLFALLVVVVLTSAGWYYANYGLAGRGQLLRRAHGPPRAPNGVIRHVLGGRYWVRTSDLFGVNEARYHCANRPRVLGDSADRPKLAHSSSVLQHASALSARGSRPPGRASAVTGPGAASSRSSQRATGLDVAGGRGQEDLAGPLDHLDRLVDLAAAAPLQDQRPGHAGQAAARQGRRAQLAVDDVEDVGAGALAQVPGEVGEHRLGRPARAWRRPGRPRSRRTTSSSAPPARPARCAATAPSRPRSSSAACGQRRGDHDQRRLARRRGPSPAAPARRCR